MNPKISGQSTKSNYKNNGSSARAVFYNEHDLREYLDDALEFGAQGKQMQFFDMEGHAVTAAEVLDKVDRHHSGLHRDDAKFYCIMLDPSDPEIAAMGDSLAERLTNGQQYVFDIMDAYARNFHREGIEDRHNLTAYAIPHLYKGEEKKEQLHWHIIVARKDTSNRYKLSPLTNHRSTTKGAVKGGFDRVAFDQECEQLFDKRFGYERKVEESFDYCLAQKKGTPEQKAEQTQRLSDQNKPDLEAAVNAFLNQRVAQLAAEAAAKAERERQEKEEAARKESALDKPLPEEKRSLKDFLDGYSRHVAEKESSQDIRTSNNLSTSLSAYSRKTEILEIFRSSKDAVSLSLNLAGHGLSIRKINGIHGLEDISVTAGGRMPFAIELSKFGQDYLRQILDQVARVTGEKLAYRTVLEIERAQRVRMAQDATTHSMQIRAAQEAARQEAQRKAAEEAERQAAQKAAQEAARLEAQRKAAEEAKRQAVQKAAQEAAQKEAQRKVEQLRKGRKLSL